jgi:hypothetical protein
MYDADGHPQKELVPVRGKFPLGSAEPSIKNECRDGLSGNMRSGTQKVYEN